MTKIVRMSEKMENGTIEPFYPETHVEGLTGAENWQKFALTQADGKRKVLGVLNQNLANLNSGWYEGTAPSDLEICLELGLPEKAGTSYVFQLSVMEGENGWKQFELILNHENQIFYKNLQENNINGDWVCLINNDTLTLNFSRKAELLWEGELRKNDGIAKLNKPITDFQAIEIVHSTINGNNNYITRFLNDERTGKIIFGMNIPDDGLTKSIRFSETKVTFDSTTWKSCYIDVDNQISIMDTVSGLIATPNTQSITIHKIYGLYY